MIDTKTKEGLEVLRHSTSHIMAAAVKQLFPDVKVAIGPAIDEGFYYDFEKETPFVPEDLLRIEKKMKEIIKNGEKFELIDMKKDEAVKFFKDLGENYKVELLEEIPDDAVTLYKTGDFTDLCRGPHIEKSSQIKAFKLLNIAGAYWRGDEKNKMLQRIYGTAFNTREELDDYLKKLEEAKKRDHRKLGKELDLFVIEDDIGPGLTIWLPKGAFIRNKIEEFWKSEHYKRDYELIYTPHIARVDLWKTSGHWDFYRENMYSPMQIDQIEYVVKPMNCPFHIYSYKTKKRSYRDLPMRLAELGTVYRYERSGVLHGLLRVRGFTQDDAHIFCTPDQLKEEMLNCVDFAIFLIKTFGFTEYEVMLATRGADFAGTPEEWDRAEETLRNALAEHKIEFTEDPGGAVFYGPKIDIKLKDALGRLWQGPTIQFDFNLPRRFDVKFVDNEGKEQYVYMVHRAMLGSLERFMGCLTEHYAGAFPVWLTHTQVQVIPVSEKHFDYAEKVHMDLRKEDIRAYIDKRAEKLGYKIRDAQTQKIPYMLIIGDKETESNNVSVRHRKDADLGAQSLEEFIKKIKEEIDNKR
ncbi:MAG: threonine--tRNA ligase [Armatimonadota bacterium]